MERKAFDVANCIVVGGIVHALTTKAEACPEYPSHDPCQMCSLREYCIDTPKVLCALFGASSEEFFYRVGVLKGVDEYLCKIRPDERWRFGYSSTVENEGP